MGDRGSSFLLLHHLVPAIDLGNDSVVFYCRHCQVYLEEGDVPGHRFCIPQNGGGS